MLYCHGERNREKVLLGFGATTLLFFINFFLYTRVSGVSTNLITLIYVFNNFYKKQTFKVYVL